MRLALIALTGVAAIALSACGAEAQNAAPAPNPATFLAQNALQPGVKSHPSGLQYQVVKSGPAGGQHPTLADNVTVRYEAILPSGEVLDSSGDEAVTFPLDGLVEAWEIALPMMVPGDEWILWAPPALAYGEAGKGPVPPNAVLKFKIELIKVN